MTIASRDYKNNKDGSQPFFDCKLYKVRSVRTPLVFLSTYDVWKTAIR